MAGLWTLDLWSKVCFGQWGLDLRFNVWLGLWGERFGDPLGAILEVHDGHTSMSMLRALKVADAEKPHAPHPGPLTVTAEISRAPEILVSMSQNPKATKKSQQSTDSARIPVMCDELTIIRPCR